MGKYDDLGLFFADLDGTEIELTFDEIEELIGSGLPTSARRHAAWWSNAQYHAVWSEHGWRASPKLGSGLVRFRRVERNASTARAPSRGSSRRPPDGAPRLLLLGCVKGKRSAASPAKDLYVSALWEKRRQYAESSGQPWRILSAEHGLVCPDQVLEPYDRHLASQSFEYRQKWSHQVARSVLAELEQLGLDTVEFHASRAYTEEVRRTLQHAGIVVHWPFEGLRQGEHQSWYLEAHPGSLSEPTSMVEEPSKTLAWPSIVSMSRIGGFDYRWPDAIEHFEYGWEGELEHGGARYSFKHGVGSRFVYGADRVHTVTFINGAPVVEGVAADDYDRRQCLLSLIKGATGAMVRSHADLPGAYRSMQVVDHRSEIDAPYSRYGLAVKIRVDDVAAWAAHALLRRGGSLPTRAAAIQAPAPPPEIDPEDAFPVAIPDVDPLDMARKRTIAGALIRFGETTAAGVQTRGGVSFSGIEEADRLLYEEPFAFLVAVICDYQIPAERAWAAPYLLKQRLGHLDPGRIVQEPDEVARAVAMRPALHRYTQRVPEFIVEAAHIVLDTYYGDADSIWADEPTARLLQLRLRQFPGISQKKAAMAVEILERDLGVTIHEMTGSDIAYDVHIRRVFLRTGLAELDDIDHMIAMARQAYPERPGALDGPAWEIGRTWCRPRNPDCSACPLNGVCARRIDAGSAVRGA